METLTLTAKEINALMHYFRGIPTEWGRDPLAFFEKKIMEFQQELKEKSEKDPSNRAPGEAGTEETPVREEKEPNIV